jgi:hypothetical protein
MPKTKETDIIEINEMKLYSVKALCDILKIHPLTIRTHIKKGKLKARQIGSKWGQISTLNITYEKLPLDTLETFGISLLSISSTANYNLQNQPRL